MHVSSQEGSQHPKSGLPPLRGDRRASAPNSGEGQFLKLPLPAPYPFPNIPNTSPPPYSPLPQSRKGSPQRARPPSGAGAAPPRARSRCTNLFAAAREKPPAPEPGSRQAGQGLTRDHGPRGAHTPSTRPPPRDAEPAAPQCPEPRRPHAPHAQLARGPVPRRARAREPPDSRAEGVRAELGCGRGAGGRRIGRRVPAGGGRRAGSGRAGERAPGSAHAHWRGPGTAASRRRVLETSSRCPPSPPYPREGPPLRARGPT